MALKLKKGEIAAGAISRNSRKGKNGPDFTGHMNTPMGEMRISVWTMTNQNTGEQFLSFSVSEKGSHPPEEKAESPASTSLAGVFDMLFVPPPPPGPPARGTRTRKEKPR